LHPSTSADADASFARHGSTDVLRSWDMPRRSDRARRALPHRMSAGGGGGQSALGIVRISRDEDALPWMEHAGFKAGSPSVRTRETVSVRHDAGVGHVQARHALSRPAACALVPRSVRSETHALGAQSAYRSRPAILQFAHVEAAACAADSICAR
jgi:hypothetical protein